jgi:hypothetical protein
MTQDWRLTGAMSLVELFIRTQYWVLMTSSEDLFCSCCTVLGKKLSSGKAAIQKGNATAAWSLLYADIPPTSGVLLSLRGCQLCCRHFSGSM